MLRARLVVLVLHLEHDGDNLLARFRVALAENEVTLGAVSHIVVLLEVGIWEGSGADLVEFRFAMALQRFAHHLRGKAGLHILHTGDFLVLVLDELVFRRKLVHHLLAQGGLGLSGLGFLQLHLCGKLIALTLGLCTCLRNRQLLLRSELSLLRFQLLLLRGDGLLKLSRLLGRLARGFRPFHRKLLGIILRLGLYLLLESTFLRGNLLFQCRDLGIALSSGIGKLFLMLRGGYAAVRFALGHKLLNLMLQLGDLRIALGRFALCSLLGLAYRKLDCGFRLGLQKIFALGQFLVELGRANLPQNVGKAAFVHLENLTAMGAFDLAHTWLLRLLTCMFP